MKFELISKCALLCTINCAVCAPLCTDTQTKAGIQCKQTQRTKDVSLLQMNPASLSRSLEDKPADVKVELTDADDMQSSQVQAQEVSLSELSEDVELTDSEDTQSSQDETADVDVGLPASGSTECHTAVKGEACYKGVIWAMQDGIAQHPEWYPDLNATSSFEDFQANLHAGGHSDCPAPCSACHTAAEGEECYNDVMWAMQDGITQHPEWYPGLSISSSFEDFQSHLHTHGRHSNCPAPCATRELKEKETFESPQLPGWVTTSARAGQGKWCSVGVPPRTWSLKSCDVSGAPIQVKVLSYNLFWWNLFGRRHGNGGSAGKLIAKNSASGNYDLMGFQEADDVYRVLRDSGLQGRYGVLAGSGMGLAYEKSRWQLLSHKMVAVGEDRREQWYGRRNVLFGRIRHRASGKTVFFGTHHGPLPVNTGGLCGGRATAYNILKTIATNAKSGDAIIMVGDFNSGVRSSEIRTLDQHLFRVFTGTAIGGIDHIYSNCGKKHTVRAQKLGRGGSDHDAIEAVMNL